MIETYFSYRQTIPNQTDTFDFKCRYTKPRKNSDIEIAQLTHFLLLCLYFKVTPLAKKLEVKFFMEVSVSKK